MLTLRQIIPPLTMRALHATPQVVGAALPEGRMVRAWDYKQKRALVIAFLHHDCGCCREWLGALRSMAGRFQEWEATALVVFCGAPDAQVLNEAPANVVIGLDVNGHSLRAFLGKDAMDRAGQTKVGVFVTDRYGELAAQWVGELGDARGGQSKNLSLAHGTMPTVKDLISAVVQAQVSCG